MKLLDKFFLLSRSKQIALVVFACHFLAIFALLCHHLATSRLRPPRPMVVRTLAAQPPPRAPIATPKVTPSAPAKKATPKPAVAKPAPAKAKTGIATTKPAPKTKAAPAAEENLLQEIAQSLETLSTETARSRPSITLPSKIASKAEIAPLEVDPTYGEIVIAYLQNELDLPEYGEVRAKIEIDSFGRLTQCQILEAKSTKNGEFLKARLPELTFPHHNERQSFTVTFRNRETH
ncbi:MAG TPA: hypothetical protein VLF94_08925 [Chlamydiales bacterium]|nr:hypothetical protein [Chlamydiales bacterium]